jgi:lipoprotein-anchoring transpeptidase ErfK/SrfK
MHRILLAIPLLALTAVHGEENTAVFSNAPALRALPADGEPANALSTITPAPTTHTSAETERPLNAKPTGDDAVRLQIFLDESNFGPGVIDGKPGRFTELAVQSWNEVNGHPPDDWSAVNRAARMAVPEPFTVAVVPAAASAWVDSTLPTNRKLQATKKRMSYRSYAEFMAERHHCDVPYLAALNAGLRIHSLKPHDSLVVPNVTPFVIENIRGVNHPADEELSKRHVVVDTKVNQVRIFEPMPVALVVAEHEAEHVAPVTRANNALVASFPITPGQPKFIRLGNYELRNMVELPWWRYDQQFLDTGKRSDNALNIPPGPNSPVGIIWNGTSKPGIGLHGTSDPETIGRSRSAGCIRLANWDAIRLPTLIRPGASVEIR